jgi:hypothetical protein
MDEIILFKGEKMIRFKVNKKLETIFNNARLCFKTSKKETKTLELLVPVIREKLTEQDDLLNKYKFLSEFLKEDYEIIGFIATMLYPKATLNEAVGYLYYILKDIDSKYNNIDNKDTLKYIRGEKEFEDTITETGFNKNLMVKIAYLKIVIDNFEKCDFF